MLKVQSEVTRKTMTRRLSALLLAITMVFQLVAPQASFAKEGTTKADGSGAKIAQQDKKKYRKIGVINGASYDGKVMNALNREAAKNRKMKKAAPGISLFSAGPYFGDNNEPTDANKPKYYGNINVDFKLEGLDGNPFQWNEIFGVDEKGNSKPAQIIFTQSDDETGDETGVEYILKVTETGKYTWSDKNGKPTKLPLFSKSLKPYSYEARVDEDVAENIKLLTARMTGTEGSSPTFLPENGDGEIIANITLDLGLQQVASTKFKSEWKTGVDEANRPQIQGSIAEKVADLYDHPVVFDLPKNNKDVKIIRDWEDAFEDGLMVADALYKTPTVKLVEINANGLTFDTAKKTVTSGDHKYKYDFKYDVIKGGKLTMTEVIPVTFDANGGKFASITESNAEQKIKKEVDYDGTLTDKAEEPKKDRETFKGWGTKDAQGKITPVTDEAFKNITKAKTFYAIWDNNAITAEELEVKESFKDGTGYVNDFIPTLETLKKQVTIKDGNGDPQALANDDIFAIVDGSNEYKADGDDLKNYLYDKLKEEDTTEVSRKVTVKAKVTHQNGTSQTVDIPIKVIKNIYEAKTLTEKPYYVPADYVKVIVDPTTKAKDPQKTYYYVNKEAKVVIPGENPEGTGNWTFAKWIIKGSDTVYELAKKPRHQFTANETTIEAQYVSDVIPQKGTEKPKNVPTNYVEVKFVPTDKATDETKAEKIFWVNPEKEVTIPVKNPVGKQYFTFKEWKMGADAKGDKYTPTTPKQFKDAATITATYDEAKNIIPFDPTNFNDPKIVRPDGYVKVTFAAEKGLKLTEQKAYYVKQNAGIKLGNAELVKPAYEEVIGYKFKEWDQGDATEIKDEDILVTAKATKLDTVIPEKTGETPNEKPTGYVEVEFRVVQSFGKISDGETKYYVKPNTDVTLPLPKTEPYIGYEFDRWHTVDGKEFSSAPTKFIGYTIIWGEFKELASIIPKTKNDGTENKMPKDYVTVTFDKGTDGEKITGQTVYYVNPNKGVSIGDLIKPEVTPKVGYSFKGWSHADRTKIKEGLNVVAEYNSFDDIIPKTKEDESEKPDGYVTLTFDKGERGTKIEGQAVYYVNPKVGKTLADITKPTITETETGWKQRADADAWDTKDDFKISADKTVKAQYEPITDVIPKTKEDESEKPDGYVTVKFVPTDKATDATKAERIFYVNPEKAVTIPMTDPKGATYYTFKEWKVGADAKGDVYKPTVAKKFTADTTITATYDKAEDIIAYDPKDPKTKPEGYVRVTFVAEEGLTLSNVQAYYVKKDANITLGNAKLVKPTTAAKTGYTFTGWDKDDATKIEATDIVVTAKATALDEFIPQKNTDGSDMPKGYVTVTFVADKNGEIRENSTKVDKKVYYVNPNKFVKLPAPTPVGNTGYDFAAWSSDKVKGDFSLANYVNYTEDTTITATFNQKDAVYPKLKDDESDKPAGYVKVTFTVTGTDGKIADKEITTYYVDPGREVSLKAPKTIAGTGFVFDKWKLDPAKDESLNPADKKIYQANTTIYGSFTRLKDIIPATNDDGTTNLQPEDYVAVLFIEGEHAQKLEGQVLYYVNPKAGKTIGDLKQPKITPDTGWNYKGWDKADTTEIKDYMFVVAQYEARPDVVPALKGNGTPNDKPAGYVTVTFVADKNGEIRDNGTKVDKKVYYVNPNKYVKLNAPNTVPGTGYVFGSWKSDGKVFSLDNFIKYEKDTTITANFNLKGNVIPKTQPNDSEKPAGFVTVNFVIEGQGGQIEANQVVTYFVKKGEVVTIHPPKTKAEVGYEFEKWDKDTTTPAAYTEDVTTVKGSFKSLNAIIKSKESNGTVNAKPEGYVTVQFLKGEHGVLDGQTTFYVNPKAGKTLNDLKPEEITIVPEKTYKFANWDTSLSTGIDKDINVTAEYTQLPNIIKAGPKDKAPVGYVVVIFETDGRGTITGNAEYEDKTNPAKNETEIVYFVNPDKKVKLAASDAKASQTLLPVPSTAPYDADKYQFDQWRAPIDKDTPITRGRVHIAMFKPKQVTLTYDANGATEGTAPAVVKVDYNTNVSLANQGGLKKKDASFAGWKIGDKIYQAGYPITLTKDTTAIAQWTEDKTIIPYDPNEPTSRPDNTYVKVTFEAETGLKLKEQKAYYVKKNAKDADGEALTLKAIKDDATKGYPAYEEQTGYKFDKWDPADTTTIADKDIVVTAKVTNFKNVIPEKDANGKINDKPDGYKEVTFVIKDDDKTKGSIEGVAKFYVKPNEFVTINPPATEAKTGYVFGTWDKDTTIHRRYTEDTTITGSFNELKDVIPNKNPNGTENKQPAGYKTVTFVIDPATGGKIQDGQVTVYYVNPAKEVTVPQPKTKADTGYSFAGWNLDTTQAKKYESDTTVKGSFTKGTDIIPSTNDQGQPNTKPDGYVTVTFDKGANGKAISGQTAYYVNPNAGKKLSNITPKPTVTPDTGFTANGWDKEDTTEIKSDITVTAQYLPKDDVIPKTKEDGSDNDKPEGYVTVTFDKGAHGKELTGQSVYYVNPNKPVVLQDKAPTAVPNTGYDFARWDTSIDKPTLYKEGDTITALYNNPDVISTKEIAGYVKVEFKPGSHGSLSGPTDYWVKPDVDVYLPSPWVNANDGYQFDGWDKSLSVKFGAGAPTYVITAKYTEKQYPTPQPDPIPQPYPTPQPNFVPYPVPGETKTVYKDRTVLRREVRYMQGFEGKFRPDDGLTRAEAAQILANALKEDGYPFDLRYKLPYKDTTKEMWYNDAVRITTQADVFIGYDDGEFKPQRKITRAEWIATLRRFQYVDKVGGNSLHMRKNHWAIPEVEAAYRSGWLSIYTEKKAPFNYDEPISRKEVAAVSNRAFRRVRDMAYIRRNDKFMINYTDINRDMWAYDDILCASNTFLHQRQGAYIAYKRGDKAYTIDVKDAIIEQDLFQRIPRHR